MSECYELSLTPNYVSDWTFNDALRELIQNGIDQETIRPDNKFSIDYDEGKEVIRLVNKNAKLKISTLLKAYGGNAVLVPSKVAALLEDETMERIEQLENLPVTEQLTLREKFQRWYDIYSDQLKNNAKDELMTLINEIM